MSLQSSTRTASHHTQLLFNVKSSNKCVSSAIGAKCQPNTLASPDHYDHSLANYTMYIPNTVSYPWYRRNPTIFFTFQYATPANTFPESPATAKHAIKHHLARAISSQSLPTGPVHIPILDSSKRQPTPPHLVRSLASFPHPGRPESNATGLAQRQQKFGARRAPQPARLQRRQLVGQRKTI